MEHEGKMIIYQVFTRLFGNKGLRNKINGTLEENGCGKMDDFTNEALHEIKKLGATHIWYTGIIAHASQTDYSAYGIPRNHPAIVKGKAGSPYAIRDYYDVDPDLAVCVDRRMEEFEALVQRSHANGLKVIVDFVPNHVARQYHSVAKPEGVKDLGEDDDTAQAFAPGNNFYYIPGAQLGGEVDLYDAGMGMYVEKPAKATGNDRFDAYPNRNDWYETVKLNYGVDYIGHTGNHFDPEPDTWRKMRDILLFWASKGIDGFRCDMAEMVPCEFWGWVIPQVKARYSHLSFIAEVYNPREYRNYIYNGHFDYLYDKVGLYDTLRALVCGYASATAITGCWQSVGDIQPHMLNFLENHDEQRIASDFFAGDARKGLPALLVSACMNTNPMMIYFGQELGEEGMDTEGFSGRDGRTTIFDYWSIPSIRRWSNHGRYNLHLLNAKEKEIRRYYQLVLNLCHTEAALSKGSFFDLMYVNQGGWLMNEHRQYAFLRKYGREVLLVVANFEPIPVHIGVNIPQHAFDLLHLPAFSRCNAVDLLTGKEELISWMPGKPVTMDVPALGGKMLKVSF
ncbi:alpha-amylase family glycosyl hydrolase [Bacteroides gallinaceum]|uniref:alpha-amylase family glycosyl hydrolase n=1 Tax=Bacteroides gallinaceum TaxID=1462571 RepID=UPI0025A34A1E|nr:alpha-amylase family glycosyl hydrolase [Bacteroides gallinaceum]MDM8152928.1 alpha-amylase family glycosyl hydrolase [Bacteroides gallinaceum]